MKRYRWACLLAALSMIGCDAAIARDAAAPKWCDTLLARTQALALLQTLNADLLSHDSATLTLERWCDAHRMASPARIVARRVHGADKPMPAELRTQLEIVADEPVKYRRVQLTCGEHVLSEADNWYLPNRLTVTMNRQLDHSDMPFGKVVQPMHFRRKTLSAELLWSPLPAGWEMQSKPASPPRGALKIPHLLLQHRALLYATDDRPFSALIETYTDQVLAFEPAKASDTTPSFDGAAALYLPDIVSTKDSEACATVSPDGSTVLRGQAVDLSRPGELLFSGKRPGMNRGRADIYAIPFQLEGD